MENTLSSRLRRPKFADYEPSRKAIIGPDPERPEQTTVHGLAGLYPARVRQTVFGDSGGCGLGIRHGPALTRSIDGNTRGETVHKGARRQTPPERTLQPRRAAYEPG